MTNNTTTEVIRAIPPKEMFQGEELEKAPLHAIGQGQLTTPITDIVFPKEGGVLVYHQGDLYPVKAWPFKEAIFAVDCVKRVLINAVKFALSSPARYMVAVVALFPESWKRKLIDRAIAEFTDYTHIVFDRWGRIIPFEDEQGNEFGLQGIVWKPQFYCDMVREFRRVGMFMAGPDERYQKLVEVVCMILAFDDAYRYRVQDGMGEINPDLLKKNPAKELVRVLTVMQQRGQGTSEKFSAIARVIPFLFKSNHLEIRSTRSFQMPILRNSLSTKLISTDASSGAAISSGGCRMRSAYQCG